MELLQEDKRRGFFSWIKGGLSYSDGSMDDGAIAALATIFAYIGNSFYAVHLGQPWHPQDFGIGAGALFGGVAALLKFRQVN